MKRLIVLMVLIVFSGTSMAGISESFDSWYDDLLEFLNLLDDDELIDDADLISGVSTAPASSEADFSAPVNTGEDSNPGVLPAAGSSDIGSLPQADSDGGDSSVITNPEPCSIILSSIGLGIAGYLRRRRAI